MQKLKRIWKLFLDQLLAKRHASSWSASLIFGVVAGLFPVIGPVTIISLAVCWLFQLNSLLVLTVLYALYPLQLLLIVPFFYLGESIWPGAELPMNQAATFWEFLWQLSKQLGNWASRAILGWAVAMIPLGMVVYRWSKRKKMSVEPQE